MPSSFVSDELDRVKQSLLTARGTVNAQPTRKNQGLSNLKPIPDESALEKWAKAKRGMLDFIPRYGNVDSRPTQVERGLGKPAANLPNAEGPNTLPSQKIKVTKFDRQLSQARVMLQHLQSQEEKLRAREIRDSSSNLARIERLRPTVERFGNDIPLSLKLGWIDKESAGYVRSDEAARQARLGNRNYDLDEVGLFQISRDERQILHLRPADRERILSDPAFAIQQGTRLIYHYQEELERDFNFSTQSPALWPLTKLAHKRGWPTVHGMLSRMENDYSEGRTTHPSEATWDEIKLNVLLHATAQKRERLSRDLMSIDFVIVRGRLLEAQRPERNTPR